MSNNGFRTVFPRTKFADENDINKQAYHAGTEVGEVINAYQNKEGLERYAEEICDLIHSAETLLHILAEKHGVDVAAIQRQVVEKNRGRGYYSNCQKCAKHECGSINCGFILRSEISCARCLARDYGPCGKDDSCFVPKEVINDG